MWFKKLKIIKYLQEQIYDNYNSQRADKRHTQEEFNLLLKTLNLKRKYTPGTDEKEEFVPVTKE